MAYMPFGRHAGKRLDQLPDSYLQWLLTIDLRPWLRLDVQAELSRRELARRAEAAARQAEFAALDDLPDAEPRNVFGINLDAYESARFEQAVRTGILIVAPELPLASRLPEAWRLWCATTGREARSREVAMDELVAEPAHVSRHPAGGPDE